MIKARIVMIRDGSIVDGGLVQGLRRRGHEILFVEDVADVLNLCRMGKPDIVLTDALTIRDKGFEVLCKINEVTPGTKIIVITENGSQEGVIRGFGADKISYLKKPVTLWELAEVVEKLIGVQHPEINKEVVIEERKKIVIDNQIEKIWGIVNQLLICAENVCERAAVQELGLGLYEIIMNAIEHGSLDITFEEKRQAIESNTYENLLRERLADPVYSERRVTIDYQMIPGELHYIVRDEGRGFDWRHLPCPDPSTNLLNPCGRGLFLARLYLDRVEFSEEGNEVHLVKYQRQNGGNHGSTGEHTKKEG